MKAEYARDDGFLQRDSVEREEYAEAQSAGQMETAEQDNASDLMETILDRDNLNKAYQKVKSNKGAPGIGGRTVEEALPWLKEHREELLESIRGGWFKPNPVRRKEIPKPDGGVRKLGMGGIVFNLNIDCRCHIFRHLFCIHDSNKLFTDEKSIIGVTVILESGICRPFADSNISPLPHSRLIEPIRASIYLEIQSWISRFNLLLFLMHRSYSPIRTHRVSR